MKKLVLLMALLPLNLFAASEGKNPDTYAMNNKCLNSIDPAERKDCLAVEKKNEAEAHFKNFQENNHNTKPEDF